MEKHQSTISRKNFLQKSVKVGLAGLTAHAVFEDSASAQGTAQKTMNFDTWLGIDRNTIQWNPTVDESKCDGCGLCVIACGRKVFQFDYENKKPKVFEPTHCMVACDNCAKLCPVGAISFKEGENQWGKVQKIVREHNVLKFAKEQLEKRKEELAYKPSN